MKFEIIFNIKYSLMNTSMAVIKHLEEDLYVNTYRH